MASIWFVEVAQHSIEIDFLYKKGIRERQVNTWKHSQRTEDAFKDIITRAGLVSQTTPHNLTPVQIPIYAYEPGINHIEDYFGLYIKYLIEKMGLGDLLSSKKDIPDVIAFNLIPFFMSVTKASRIARGIATILAVTSELKNQTLLFITSQHTLFSESPELIDLSKIDNGPSVVSIIDFEGNFCTYSNHNGIFKIDDGKLNARDARDKVLVHSEDSLKIALAYDTNMNIGHFDLGSCHVRTHYDLEDFVTYDNVFETIYKKFTDTVKDFKKIHIIATGLEDEALNIIGNRILYNTENDIKMQQGDTSDSDRIEWHSHFSYDQLIGNPEMLKRISSESECILLLTDVTNTGGTVNKLKDYIEGAIFKNLDLTDESKDWSKIILFSIVKMNNSPRDIIECVEISRPYLPNDSKLCPLCILNQPLNKVSPENWKHDFRIVDQEQLTPLDFWELVEDCKAFQPTFIKNSEKKFLRVKTKIIIRRYRKWLKTLIREKYRLKWNDKNPNAIITVDEETGKKFASVFMEALDLPENILLAIHKDILSKKIPPPTILLEKIEQFSSISANALFLDTGVNTGGTMKLMKDYFLEFEIFPYGAFVLDNRLSTEKMKNVLGPEFVAKFESLYTWPFTPRLL